ncbi:adenylate/guanylate cyclase domain-containing protein [Seohaeicola saemankumensis]|nr:adenylate/guanylate cyclase domain-containing protein [Seohaeicola saemankumensis]MCA0869885.1 adenylate/guanylate cyclase domain-containing protein [Seohaeicola saemankumensis]
MSRADAEAEKLIGIVRIATSIILGLSIIVMAQSASERSAADHASAVLAAAVVFTYFLLGLASITVVRARRLKPWMSWAFGIADVALVLANLHIAALLRDADSSVMLSAPASFFAVLVFVSQLLRFRPNLQIFLTVLLVAGLGLATLARISPSLDASDLEFLADNFELPPNIARLVIIAMIGSICILAVWRARNLVWDISRQSEVNRNITPFLPQELRSDLSDARLAYLKKGRSAEVVVMFVDIRGFTALAEHIGPEETTRLLTGFRELVVNLVQLHEGRIDKFVGDGVLIVFGLDGSLDQAARNAISAAEGLGRAIASWSRERAEKKQQAVDVVIAVHAGRAIVGAIGDEHHLEFGIFGSVVNEASRIEGIAKSLEMQIVVSDAVFLAASINPKNWQDLGSRQLRGRTAPLRLFGSTRKGPIGEVSSSISEIS